MSREDQIKAFLNRLSAQTAIENVTNQYLKGELLANLHSYLSLLLSYPYSGHLLVGEAPGIKGCAMCGIPLTSQRVLNESDHLFIEALRPTVHVSGNQTERTATIVWGQLEGKRTVPAFWNVFPFHPHLLNEPTQNRTPSAAEVAVGVVYLESVVSILQPHTVIAVGGTASAVLEKRYSGVQYRQISHPSQRGYSGFITGFAELGIP